MSLIFSKSLASERGLYIKHQQQTLRLRTGDKPKEGRLHGSISRDKVTYRVA